MTSSPRGSGNILATVTQDNKCYFSPRHVCEALSISWAAQFVKIQGDPVLSSTVSEIEMVARDGKNRKVTMLPIEFLSGWLFTIKKVRPEVQAKLNLYRAEGFLALKNSVGSILSLRRSRFRTVLSTCVVEITTEVQVPFR